MTKVWAKVPRTSHPCVCGCGEVVTGTKRKMYAKPYCKYKMYLERKRDPNWVPDSKYNHFSNPLGRVIPFPLGEEDE